MSPSKLFDAILLLSCFLSAASAFNITRILNNHPEFSNFNDLLTQTGLSSEINQRTTITILAVSNDRIGDLNGKPIEVAESILRTHIVLDYFDIMKLNRLKGHTAKLTTMYQQTGVATHDQGFLNVTTGKDGILFGSAVKNAHRDARLEGSVMSRPYNISVLSISQPIATPGLDGESLPPASPPKAPTPAPAPSHKKKKKAAAKTPVGAAVEAEAPAEDADSPAGSPQEPVDGPEAADGPAADGPEADDAEAPEADSKSSSAGKTGVSVGGIFLLLSALVAAQ